MILQTHQNLLGLSEGFYLSSNNNYRMKAKQKPFTINLLKIPAGYVVQSAGLYSAPRGRRSHKPNPERNIVSRPTTRLARQLNLGNQPPSVSQQPAPTNGQQSMLQIDPPNNENQEEEQYVFQIKRQSELPQNPAKWFSLDQIHEIQRVNLPEFFISKSYKTPELYTKIRDFIVSLYKKNPAEYLTKTTCRRILRGDANMIIRVHNFLQKQGIINFGLHPEGLYTFNSSFINKSHEMQHIPQSNINQVPQEDQQIYDLSVKSDNLTFSVVNKPFSRTFRVYCSLCELICGIFWFSHKTDQSKLCFDCYKNLDPQKRQFYDKSDIIEKMNLLSNNTSLKGQVANGIKQQAKRNTWTIEDNMKLLQMMSQSGKSWKQLTEAFQGRKSIEDIILQFMQFPISNFSPSQKQISNKQKGQIDYKPKQYFQIIDKYYNKSYYAIKKQKNKNRIQEQILGQNKYEISDSQTSEIQKYQQPDNTHLMITSTLKKYDRRISNFLSLQQAIMKSKDLITNKVVQRKPNFQLREQFNEKSSQIKHNSQLINNHQLNYNLSDDDDQIFPDSRQQQIKNEQQRDVQSYQNMLNLEQQSQNLKNQIKHQQ